MKKIVIVLISAFIATPALAQFVVSPGIGYYSDKSEINNTESESTETRLDARFGYVLPMGLYLGGTYSYFNQENCSGSTCTDGGGNMLGPTIGYYSMRGFYTLFTYHITGEAGDDPKFTGAQGPQVDVGWVFPLSSFFAIGPQLTWRSIEYDKVETSGVSQDTDLKNTSIAPYVSLWFMF